MKCFVHELVFQAIHHLLEDFEPRSPDSLSDDDDEDEPEEHDEAMMASPAALQVVDMSPTKVILDLGCTKAMVLGQQ